MRTTIRHAEPHYIIEESYIDDRGVVVITSARLLGVGMFPGRRAAAQATEKSAEQDDDQPQPEEERTQDTPRRPLNPLRDPRYAHGTDKRQQRPVGPREQRPQ